MARMHTRKKGKAGSHRNKYTEKPSWVKMSEEEITDVIVQSKRSGSTSSEIGIKLRDQFAPFYITLIKSTNVKRINVIYVVR